MPNLIPPVRFSATGSLQLYLVPETGSYLLEARGAQGGGDVGAVGGRGACLRGVFSLNAGDILHIVVGEQGLPGMNIVLPGDGNWLADVPSSDGSPLTRGAGGGGGTFIWKGTMTGVLPTWPLLAAGGGGGGGHGPGGDGLTTLDASRGEGPGGRNGHGGASDLGVFYYSGGGGAGWISPGLAGAGPTYCQGGGHWAGGAGASFGGYQGGHGGFGGGGGGSFFGAGAGGGGGYSGGAGGGGRTGTPAGGGGSYNGGREQQNLPGLQTGHGYAAVSFIPAGVSIRIPGNLADRPGDSGSPFAPAAKPLLPALPGNRWRYIPN